MSRIAALDPNQATGKTREMLDGVQRMLGATPNLFRTAARAPSALEAMVGLFGATAHATLRPRVRGPIALAVAEANGCDYCLAAHGALGKGAGLSDVDIDRARDGESNDPKTTAILRFARSLVFARGATKDEDLAALRSAGVTDEETLEVVAIVVLNIFTNYVNLVADTDIDFPRLGKKAA